MLANIIKSDEYGALLGSKLLKTMAVSAILLFLASCSHIEVNDVTIKIRPYNESDRGRFWNICIDYENVGLSDKPIAYFEIHSKDNQIKEYSIDFIHLKQKCNEKNILVSFTHRNTPHEEWKWLKELDAEDIEHVNVKVKHNWEDDNYVFEKKINSKELK